MTRRAKTSRGFTIVELSLAMTFVSVLLLAIAMTAIQAGRIYNKGLVLESVNQAGRDIGDSLRRDFAQFNALGAPSELVTWAKLSGVDRSGRLCLGGYSYAWNTPQVVSGQVSDGPIVKNGATTVNFVRVHDPAATLCDTSSVFNDVASMQPANLLDAKRSDAVLSVHSFEVIRLDGQPIASEVLYKISYTIGTSELGALDSQRCRPPADSESNDSFCAINNFEIIVRTNG